MQTEQVDCSSLDITEAQMQYIRQEATASGGGAGTCPDPKPLPAQCSGNSTDATPIGEATPIAEIVGGVVPGVLIVVAAGVFICVMLCKNGRGSGRSDGNTPPPPRGMAPPQSTTSSSVGHTQGRHSQNPQAAVAIPMDYPGSIIGSASACRQVAQAQPMGESALPIAQGRPLWG